MTEQTANVLIAGIGGASLGTELLKCILKAEKYVVYGADISEFAFGHYQEGFEKTFVIDRSHYIDELVTICRKYSIQAILPGGEEPLVLIGLNAHSFRENGVAVAANSPEVVHLCTDKEQQNLRLKEMGVAVPETVTAYDVDHLKKFPLPCIIKPVTGSGGSTFVFLAFDELEAKVYLKYLLKNRSKALVQEYIPHEEGEFTVGVLSYPDGTLAGSIAMRRLFHSKLSVLSKTKTALISSGYSQGLIDDFPEVCGPSEKIAQFLGSTGPLNVQGRLHDGVFYPFEINPRFSASTYLRCMAGFNEVDAYLQCALFNKQVQLKHITAGYYLRSLSEQYVQKERLMP